MPTKEKEQVLIRPFKSKLLKDPAVPGARTTKGDLSNHLDNMGYKGWAQEGETIERREAFENHLRWDIAHKSYKVLEPCVSIEQEYDESMQRLYYMIDLYGDGSTVTYGHIHINRADFLLFYMRMPERRRKDVLIARIALANVGMLVPYTHIDQLTFDNLQEIVSVDYRVVL